jgi:hypothetical protein
MKRLAAVLLLACASCGTSATTGELPHVLRAEEAPRWREREYGETLKRYTKSAAIYDGFDQRVFATATWRSPAFRAAYLAAEAEMLVLGPADRAARAAQDEADGREFTDLVLGFYTPQASWNELAVPNGLWRIELIGKGGEPIAPLRIERTDRPDANFSAFYPYLGPFWVAYRLRFPRLDAEGRPLVPESAPEFMLRLVSAVGKVELTWSLVGEAGPTR